MLVGRDRERQALEELLARARAGQSGVLALVGEPGIGKSALLDCAGELAHGMRVLRARGVESEAQVPFAGLFELLRPALASLETIPRPQAKALESALALRPGRAEGRFAVGAATLSVLAAQAEEQPLALLVDDVQWLDGSTADALLFAVRRLLADRVAVVLATRDGEPSLLDGADLPTLRVAGLDQASAAELLGPEHRHLAERLHRDTGGNPLALLELAAHGELADAGPPDLPVAAVTSVGRTYLQRVAALPERTRDVLLLAAAHDGGDLSVLARAASRLELDLADLDAAETAGLVRVLGSAVAFRHPLVRSTVYANAPAGRRREAHRALADALPDADADRRAWHLALAAVGPDASASSALEQAGQRARSRSAYVVASHTFERAAQVAPDPGRVGWLRHAAADAAWLGGLPNRATALLPDRAHIQAAEPALRARVEHLRGQIAARRGPLATGLALLIEAAAEAADAEPDQAMVMLADAAQASFYAGDAAALSRAAGRAQQIRAACRDGRSDYLADLLLGMARVFSGEGEAGAISLRAAVETLEDAGDLEGDPRRLTWATFGPLWLREAGVGRELMARTLAAARSRTAVGALPLLLNLISIDQAGAGDWAAAEAGFDEAMRLARESGQHAELAASLSRLAWLVGRQGHEDACRAYAVEALDISREVGAGLCEIWTHAGLADLELGLGRPAQALVHLEAQRDALEARGILDPDLSPAPELVDVLLRLGRPEEAESAARDHGRSAAAKGQPWALARAARARGLLAPDDELDPPFRAALDLHDQTPDSFEAGRTLLAYGSRLRRARRRVEAREQLRAAIGAFERLGAEPWVDQARAELAASGETARRRDPTAHDALTPQELRIGLLLADGRTTREAAAALFLSPKTIEYHLHNVYRKLGVRSRKALAGALAARS